MRIGLSKKALKIGIRSLSALTRWIPFRRKIPPTLIEWSLRFHDLELDYTFYCPDSRLRWSARGFPDVLTRHMMFEGSYQTSVLSTIRALARPGDIVFDVGGHHGLMALVASRAVGASGSVITFEPNPAAREQLRHHIKLNNAANVTVVPAVLSERTGSVPFYVQTGLVTWNSSIVREFVDPRHEIESIAVESMTLDGFVEESGQTPTLIKIDTEGSDFAVLRGADRTLRKSHPFLVMEFNPKAAERTNTKISEIVDYLRSLSYTLWVPQRDVLGYYRFSRREPFDELAHCSGGELRNVVCIPETTT